MQVEPTGAAPTSLTLAPHPLPMNSPEALANCLGIPLRTLTFLFYALPPRKRYETFTLMRRSGVGTRTIHAPIRPIKEVQRKLAELLAPLYRPRVNVHGYIRSRSIISNARVHSRQQWVLRVDLEDFFPTIHFGRVIGLFKAPPFSYSLPVARLLASICCYRSQLPLGAPTSPLISNLICRGLDRDLARLARSQQCYYSRYCDDLTFSTRRRSFPTDLAEPDQQTGVIIAGRALEEVIKQHGFRINMKKTSLRQRTQRQMVTGLIVNQIPNIPKNHVRSVRGLLYIWRAHGLEQAEARFIDHKNRPPQAAPADFAKILRGKVQFYGSVKGWHSSVYKTLARKLSLVDNSFRPTSKPSKSPLEARIFCEGKTDYSHIKAALRHFQEHGEFVNLVLDAQMHVGEGHDGLFKMCANFSIVQQSVTSIFIFDRDNDGMVKKVDGEDGFQNWQNNVYSLPIPVPQHRSSDEKVCIELLYEDDFLALSDPKGRRVFQLKDFDTSNGIHTSGNFFYRRAGTSLIPDEVIEIATKANVALSKSRFAEAVVRRDPPHNQPNFEGFRTLFEMLLLIRQSVLGE